MTLSGTEIFHNTAVMGSRPLSTVPPSTASFVTSRSSPSHLVRASWAPSANTDRTGYFDHHPDLLSFNNSLGGTSPQQPLQHHQHSHDLHLSQPMSLHESASGSYFDEVRNTSAPPTVQSLRTRMSSIIPEEAPSDLEEWSRQSQDPGKQINVVASVSLVLPFAKERLWFADCAPCPELGRLCQSAQGFAIQDERGNSSPCPLSPSAAFEGRRGVAKVTQRP